MRKMMSCLLAASMAVTLFAGSFSVPAYAAETGSLDTGAGLSEFIAADTEEASEEVNPDGAGAGYTEASAEAVYPDQAGTGTEGTVESTGAAKEDIPDTLSFVMEGDDGSVSDTEYMLEETGEVLDISQSDDTSKETASYAYTGKAIKPVVHIYDGDTYLCEKADFTVSYKNNKNPYTYKNGDTATKSTPSVIVKMKGNYSGTVTLYFEIRPVGTEYTYAVSPGVAYKGKEVKVVPEVYGFYNGPAKLKIGKDFVISSVTKDSKSYTNFVENKNLTVDGAGSYEVTLKYINDGSTSKTGTYTGEKTFTVTAVDVTASGSKTPISKVGLGKSKNLVIKGDCSQSENVTLPDLTVKAGSNTLKASDYTVDWYFNEDGKTANVCVAADDSSEYVGEKVVKVKLAGTGKIADTKGNLRLAYTGEAVEFDIVTTDNTNAGQLCVLNSEGKALTEGTDFTVSYENNTRVGKGTLIIKGCNEYCASVLKKTFTISSSGTLTVSVEDKDQVPYTQKGTKGNVTVTYTQGDKTYTLAEKTDYTLKYENNTALGKATVTATGKGTYKGATGSCDYNIVKSTDADKVWVDAADVVLSSGLTGAKAKKTKVVVSETGTGAKLKAKTDYEIAGFYTDEAMTSELSDSASLSAKDVIYVKITGKGNYEGLSATGIFRVYEKTNAIKSAKVTLSDNAYKVYDETKKGFYYTGSEITPGIGNYEGTLLVDGVRDKFQTSRDSENDGYFIDPTSFLKNVNKGTGSFMLYGTGSLGGSKKVSFKILQKPFSGERGSLDGSETLKLIGESGNLESAYVMWEPYSGKNTVDGYNVYYREKSEDSWTKADDMLVRSYAESAGSTEVAYWRADVPGLAAGEYCLKVVGKTGSEELNVSAITEVLTVKAHDRSGYAFTGDQTPGAYKADGTLKDDAYVLYVTEKTKDTVTMYVTTDDSGTKTLCVGIQSILSAYSKGYETHSMAVRMIGNITDPTNLNSGDLGVGNRNYKGCGITIEGVGDDTVANGFGISIGYGNYIEVRNLAVMNCDSSEGDSISLAAVDYYVWVHNCDLFYGEPGSDSDQKKGDGALDCKWSSNATFSYNHFWDTGKSNLLGLVEKVESTADDALYVTYHHNWYDHSDSRHPRVRWYNAHVYNNYYDGVGSYGIGATKRCSVFAEGNYFRNAKYPIKISQQGSDVYATSDTRSESNGSFNDAENTSEKEEGGMVKAYNNYMTGSRTYFIPYKSSTYTGAGSETSVFTGLDTTKDFDAVVVENRSDTVPDTITTYNGGNKYSNFDTAEDFYAYEADTPEDAMKKVTAYAGRLEGGDLTYTFTAADDESTAVNEGLKTLIENYRSSIVSIPAESSYTGIDNADDEGKVFSDSERDTVTIAASELGLEEINTVTGDGKSAVVATADSEAKTVTLTSISPYASAIVFTVTGETGKTNAYINVTGVTAKASDGTGGIKYTVTKASSFIAETVSIGVEALGLTPYSATPDDTSVVTASVSDSAVKITSAAEGSATVTVKDASGNQAVIVVTVASSGTLTYVISPYRADSIVYFDKINSSYSAAGACSSADFTVTEATGAYADKETQNGYPKIFPMTVSGSDVTKWSRWKSNGFYKQYEAEDTIFSVNYNITPISDVTLKTASCEYYVNKDYDFCVDVTVDDNSTACSSGNGKLYSFKNVELDSGGGIPLTAGTTYTVTLALKAENALSVGSPSNTTNLEVSIADFVLGYSFEDVVFTSESTTVSAEDLNLGTITGTASSNALVSDVSFTGSNVTIKSKARGKSVITVTDSDGKEATVKVSVSATGKITTDVIPYSTGKDTWTLTDRTDSPFLDLATDSAATISEDKYVKGDNGDLTLTLTSGGTGKGSKTGPTYKYSTENGLCIKRDALKIEGIRSSEKRKLVINWYMNGTSSADSRYLEVTIGSGDRVSLDAGTVKKDFTYTQELEPGIDGITIYISASNELYIKSVSITDAD